ncbi:peroxiredoxin family protein [Hugenholtzia roseola]|uniref:peroxiredoxin family protein n=1 Tax=Hugenholtzia roseola TaxID=1002 RepID=UPI000684C755|nr:TlpA disulfide reductase family protein [Hugenholtzia roseola]
MKIRQKKSTLLIALLTLLFCTLNACSGDELGRGAPAPDFEAINLTTGKKVKLSDYKGKVVMLYFWADWCPTCKKEFPETQAYYAEIQQDKAADFELLAINYKQEIEASEKFKQEFNISFPMLPDKEGEIAALYQVDERLPTNYFIDPEGKIIRKILGWVDKKQVNIMIEQHKQK